MVLYSRNDEIPDVLLSISNCLYTNTHTSVANMNDALDRIIYIVNGTHFITLPYGLVHRWHPSCGLGFPGHTGEPNRPPIALQAPISRQRI